MKREKFFLISSGLAATNVVYAIKADFLAERLKMDRFALEGYAMLLLWLPLTLFWIWCASRRCKDIGLGSTSVFRLLYPFYNFYFIFVLLFSDSSAFSRNKLADRPHVPDDEARTKQRKSMKSPIAWMAFALHAFLLPIQAGDPYLSELVGKKFIEKLKEGLPEMKKSYDAGAFSYQKSVSIGEMLSGVQYLEDWSIRSTQGHDIATVFLMDTNSASYSWARHIPSSARSYEVKPLDGTVGIRHEAKTKVFKIGVIARDAKSTEILIELANRINFEAILDSVKLRLNENSLKK